MYYIKGPFSLQCFKCRDGDGGSCGRAGGGGRDRRPSWAGVGVVGCRVEGVRVGWWGSGRGLYAKRAVGYPLALYK